MRDQKLTIVLRRFRLVSSPDVDKESGIFNTKEYRLSLAYDSVTGDQDLVEIFKLKVFSEVRPSCGVGRSNFHASHTHL